MRSHDSPFVLMSVWHSVLAFFLNLFVCSFILLYFPCVELNKATTFLGCMNIYTLYIVDSVVYMSLLLQLQSSFRFLPLLSWGPLLLARHVRTRLCDTLLDVGVQLARTQATPIGSELKRASLEAARLALQTANSASCLHMILRSTICRRVPNITGDNNRNSERQGVNLPRAVSAFPLYQPCHFASNG